MDASAAKENIKSLVERYRKAAELGHIKKYTEEDIKKGFILPLFDLLGWDTRDRDEVSSEEHIKSSGRVDYGFYLNGGPKFYLEAKSPKTDILREDHAKQAIKYSWNKGATWAVLTNFERLIVFNAQDIKSSLANKRLFSISCNEFVSEFDKLWLLSKSSFATNELDHYAEKIGKKYEKIPITALLYKDLNECRSLLTKSLAEWNPDLKISRDLLDEGVQKLLDRLIFIRVAEDRGVEPPTLLPLIREWESSKMRSETPLYTSMTEKFRELDRIYDSNLFQEHPFEKWEEHSDATKEAIKILYGKEGYYEYDFKVMPTDVLGSVYENYLGHRLSKSRKGLTIDKDAAKRKEHGIYYTPAFIVDYIVRHALGPILDKCKTIDQLLKIKILDPACGSGSFLIKALELLVEKYKSLGYKADEMTKMIILTQNLYGVDLDEQAVEITRLNLLINSLNKRTLMPSLENNIKCGNSLISGTDAELKKYFGPNFRDKKAFNWQEEFPDVLKRGGSDVVIGNPPWVAEITADYQYLAEYYPDSTKEKKDTYKTFIDKAIQLLRSNGNLGFIVPSSFLYQPSYEDIKEIIEKHSYKVINLGEKIFHGVELPCCMLILEKNSKSDGTIIDLTKQARETLPKVLSQIDFNEYKKTEEAKSKIIKKTLLTLGDVFELKDGGIQYHRSGIGLSNKGGSDLYERIFCSKSENKFKGTKETWYGKLMNRYYIADETDELFNLDYKSVLNKNESVSFTKEAFEQKEKILWRQTAPSLLAVIDIQKRWFRNTIQCGYLKDNYKDSADLWYALAIFNSRYIDYVYRKMVLETGRVFPQVKIKYLKQLPFVIPQKDKQQFLAGLAKRITDLNKKLVAAEENSNEWMRLKSEIEKSDKKIEGEVYKLYGLTAEEIAVIEESRS